MSPNQDTFTPSLKGACVCVCVSHQPRANTTVPRHKLLMAARRRADPARISLPGRPFGSSEAVVNTREIATSHDFDTTSEQFGEMGGYDPEDLIRVQRAAGKLSAELSEPLEPR